MPDPFKASVITPESLVLEATVSAAQVPVHDGLIGILKHRAPLLAKLGTGVLRLDTVNGGTQRYLVSGGYAQMKGDELTILTTEAIPAAQVTREMIAAEEAKLSKIAGTELKEMMERQATQSRIAAMRSANSGK